MISGGFLLPVRKAGVGLIILISQMRKVGSLMTKSLASSQTASKGWDPKITLSVTRLARHHHLKLPVTKQVAVPGKSGSCLECQGGRVVHRGSRSFSVHMDCSSVHTVDVLCDLATCVLTAFSC